MLRRRSLLITGAVAALAPLLHRKARAEAPTLAPLGPGSKLRAVNPGTWMDPDRDLQPLIDRCAAEGWQLEIPPVVKQQWRYFSAPDAQRVAELLQGDPRVRERLLEVGRAEFLSRGESSAGTCRAEVDLTCRAEGETVFIDADLVLLLEAPERRVRGAR